MSRFSVLSLKLVRIGLKVSVLGLLVSGVWGCGPKTHYSETHEFPNSQWRYADSLVFSPSIADTTRLYDLILKVEHHPDFTFQNVYTRILTRFPDAQNAEQILSLELEKAPGIWLSDCNNQSCILEIPLQQKTRFPQMGTYQFVLHQYNRTDTLQGIQRLSLVLEYE